jgi:N-acetylglucosaminyl-diphospho-decaprenol L-rhamnosyltransferase
VHVIVGDAKTVNVSLRTMMIATAIVNYNTRELLRTCLKSVAAEKPDEIVVIDNASSDGSAEMVASEFPTVTLYRCSDNRGYGAAANLAISRCAVEYVLLLNSDTVLRPGALQALTGYLSCHPAVAVAGPSITNPDGSRQTSCFRFPTPVHVFLYLTGLYRAIRYMPFVRGRSLRAESYSAMGPVPWVLGAALAVRRKAFGQIGGFDESFFMYFEEVDLCYRLAQAGWQVHFAPVAEVIHVGGASTVQYRAEMLVRYFVSLAQFYRYHYTFVRLIQLIVLVDLIVLGYLVRDAILYRLVRDPSRRAHLSTNMAAWRRVLAGCWWKGASRG